MTDTPKRIWAARGLYDISPDIRSPAPTEYVRADLYARLQEQVAVLTKERDEALRGNRFAQLERLATARAEAAEAERDRLREALEPFRRVLAVTDALPAEFKPSDDIPLREVMPGAWPSIGELRGVLAALQKEPQL